MKCVQRQQSLTKCATIQVAPFFQDVSCGGALRYAKSAQRHQSRLMFEKRQGRGVLFVLFGFLRRRLPDNTVVYFF